MIYLGAVIVLFLFVVMFLDQDRSREVPLVFRTSGLAAPLFCWVLLFLPLLYLILLFLADQ